MSEPILKTVKDIPLVKVGEAWPASNGNFTFTPEDLQSAVAALDDPEVRNPVLKLGHEGPLTSDQPAFGKFVNLRYDEDDQTIYADAVGVPSWLAKVMPTSYPSRSIEGEFEYVSPQSGRHHRFIIKAVSLLGPTWPGITNLDDLELALTSDDPEEVYSAMRIPVTMASSADDVRRSYYELPEVANDWNLWITQMFIDPPELIVQDDADGQLYRVPFSVKNDEITFGDPQAVKVQYVNAARAEKPLAVFASRAESRPEPTPTKEMSVSLAKKLAAMCGLDEGATEEEILKTAESKIDNDDGSVEEPIVTEEKTSAAVPEPVAAAKAVGTVTLDDETYQRLMGAVETVETSERDSFIEAAVREGKFPRARIAHYAKAWDADKEGTKALINGLAPGLIPVAESGTVEASSSTTDDAMHEAYMRRFNPQAMAKLRARTAGLPMIEAEA